MTLYLHNEDAYDLYPGLPDVFRSLVKAGVLVPVEGGGDKDKRGLKNHITQQDAVIKSLKRQLEEAKRAVGEETP